MRYIALLLLIAFTGCKSTSVVLSYSGEDFVDGFSGLRVEGKKEEGFIFVSNVHHPFVLALPYAEDWTFQPTDRKPVFGMSLRSQMFVTVQTYQPGRKVEEESFLREEYLKNLKEHSEKAGMPCTDIVIEKHLKHFVLQYQKETPMENGTLMKQTHFWGFRQHSDDTIYEVHLSTNTRNPEKHTLVCKAAQAIIGGGFFLKSQ